MKLKFSWQIFEKYSDIKFHENASNGSRVVACGRTDMTKLLVDFRNFVKCLKITSKVVETCETFVLHSENGNSKNLKGKQLHSISCYSDCGVVPSIKSALEKRKVRTAHW